jgi:Helix-turn-helix domain
MAASDGHYAMRTKPIAVARRAYLVNEACAALGISRSSAYEGMNSGEIPYVIICGRRHIPADAVEALVRGKRPSQRTSTPPTATLRRRKQEAPTS